MCHSIQEAYNRDLQLEHPLQKQTKEFSLLTGPSFRNTGRVYVPIWKKSTTTLLLLKAKTSQEIL